MRHSVTIGFSHGSETPAVVLGPEHAIDAHKDHFRKVNALREHPKYSRIEIWTSDAGRITRKRFGKPEPVAPADSKPEGKKAEGESKEKPTDAKKPASKPK